MRFLALFLMLTVAASAADVRIVRVFSGWRDAASFKRISEYFTGRENHGGQTVLRTQAGERGGYYFLVRTANAGAAQRVRFELSVAVPGAHEPRRYSFPAELPAGRQVFNLGVTGRDWPSGETDAVAWKIELVDASSGATIATEKSYLWERPGLN